MTKGFIKGSFSASFSFIFVPLWAVEFSGLWIRIVGVEFDEHTDHLNTNSAPMWPRVCAMRWRHSGRTDLSLSNWLELKSDFRSLEWPEKVQSKRTQESVGSPGLVVMCGDSCTWGCEFESDCWILENWFFTCCCKTVLVVAQLVKWSLAAPEIDNSNPVVGNFILYQLCWIKCTEKTK